MPEPNPSSPSLARWLHIATYDLCEEVKPRLCAEITEHFNAAFDEALAQGKDRAAAEAAALKALGNPFDAGDAFNRSYLTLSDKEFIRQNFIPSRRPSQFMAIFFAFIIFAPSIMGIFGLVPGGWIEPVENVALILLICLTFFWVDHRLARISAISWHSRFLISSLTGTLLALLALAYGWLFLHKDFDFLYVFFLIIYWCRAWPIIRKLSRDPKLNSQHFLKGPDQHA